ncbi:HD domain-containing protein [Lentzea flaviverrucosa]|uniref:HD domain-containing protein n=1 Tax=Lentzea flaviverrucosa TaxID=200379 RepID=A0A1H9XHS1_9PSEU|nr:HD domain-containing protein [Lentzea flaviverrucosa]RDI20174.1 HD domain-containing protein [Lentzea flaviverrucosa]SES45692.1 HD domain-containing protein [Lentzea flaviverrucosa]
MFTLEDAIAIATTAHDGQVDKSGRPYIGHPLRVMASLTGEHEQMAAVLHDVIEDTPVTADDLRAHGCPAAVVDAVVALSHLPEEPQEDYLRRVAANPLALSVKRADISDNLAPARIAQLDEATQERLKAKYARALGLLDEYVS